MSVADRFEKEYRAKLDAAILSPDVGDALSRLQSLEDWIHEQYTRKRLAKWQHRALLLVVHSVAMAKLVETEMTTEIRRRWRAVCELCDRLDARGISPVSLTTCAFEMCAHLRAIGQIDEAVELLGQLDQRMEDATDVRYKTCRKEINAFRKILASSTS